MALSFGPNPAHLSGELRSMFRRYRHTLGSAMPMAMVLPVEQREIFGPVVEPVPVDVVNMLSTQEWPAKGLLHYPAMLQDVALMGLRMLWQAQQVVALGVHISALAALHAAQVVTRQIAAGLSLYRAISARGDLRNRGGLTAPTLAEAMLSHGNSIAV